MSQSRLKKAQLGVGLPEIMVAMLLLGVAVIGFAGLQVRALSTTNSAMYRTQAASIAQEFGERMFMNRTAVTTYTGTWNLTAVTATQCVDNTCTPIQMAQYDIRTMSELAQATLPNGQVAVRQCIGKNIICVYVSWNQTTPTVGSSAPHCALSTDAYVPDADCIKISGTIIP